MKKIPILFIFLVCISFAYTQNDLANASFLSQKSIIKFQNDAKNYRLDDSITRAELLNIALKIKGSDLISQDSYKCKRYFLDVIKNDWICQVVELSADYGIISRENTKFRPQDKITKAEVLSILLNIIGREGIPGEILEKLYPDYNSLFDADAVDWQKGVIARAKELSIIDSYSSFYPNKAAMRSEVFNWVRKFINFKENVSPNCTSLELSTNIVQGGGEISYTCKVDGGSKYYVILTQNGTIHSQSTFLEGILKVPNLPGSFVVSCHVDSLVDTLPSSCNKEVTNNFSDEGFHPQPHFGASSKMVNGNGGISYSCYGGNKTKEYKITLEQNNVLLGTYSKSTDTIQIPNNLKGAFVVSCYIDGKSTPDFKEVVFI